ncbi:3-dehydroquinate synthase [Campylobacter sp. MIT 97-5078]|uniref:3-dehydroquinate synthase n=1 Tax=Campylobacter sp. MIT 97-5078 TaxID=1548153 RepID=UPI0005130DD4|nr:3-dehydroquinate synthase [Campylobacter sp. MIT 97-5078]KGI55352.1 3-dehydroquinate synthase [Campylobacter sp. MIT 97-5078]TQR28215.1 3-dehydroquinate synthase [Campylobacter sp. MIT 97-5078]
MNIKVNLEKNSYEVSVNELKKLEFKGKVAVVSNAKIAGLHLQSLLSRLKADEVFIITLKDGEQYKNLQSIEELLNQLFISKLDRKSTLIAFGGGVISDIVGFGASIYQRGIDFINIPTTLLAMVDAAVGGKTGVNNAFGKNLIGSFYQPRAVYCESEFLKTLPQRELSAGMAEFIKMAITFDEKKLEFIEKLDENAFFDKSLDDVIYAQIIFESVKLKADIVSKDEKENDLRMLLNYGHTFAHVIENQTQYKTFLHGEAVAIGINMANQLALKLGFLSEVECKKVEKLLHKFKLPTYYKIKDSNEFYEAFFLDKKSLNAKLHFILPQGLGRAVIKNDIKKELILEVLTDFTKGRA